MTPITFGTDGWRAVIAEDYTFANLERVARATAQWLLQIAEGSPSAVIGYDTRFQGEAFAAHVARVFASSGIRVQLADSFVTTPSVSWAAKEYGHDAGIVITASHNPPEYNGFKIGAGKTTFHGSEIQELRKLIEAGDFEKAARPGKVQPFDIITPYAHFVRQTVKVGRPGMKIVIDAGNGVGGHVAVPLFKAMGFEVVPLYCEMDARFPNHHPDPTVTENLEDLIAAVKKEKAEVGIAYDGDADRIGVIDDQGNILWGDQLMILFSRYVLKESPGAAIVGEVKCSYTLYDDIREKGGQPIMWKAGHSLIKAKMKESHAQLAGEMSGHIFFADRFYGFDDATYAGARLLEILSNTDRPLSHLFEGIPQTFSTPELRVDCPDDIKFDVVAKVTELYAKTHKVITIDGARISFENGWGLVRPSNTQAMLVLRFEADTEKDLEAIRSEVETAVAAAITEISQVRRS
jgi:phosphomannomutase / phosphoglucomutase